MSLIDIKDLASRAAAFLEQRNSDAAINILRVDESCENPVLAAMLAKAYFQRGDTKGDIHSSCFFAGRALELGDDSNAMRAIKAIGEFRKEEYEKAAATFATYVTEQSGASTRHLYGLALYYSGRAEADKWLEEKPEPSEQISTKIVKDLKPNLGGVGDKRTPEQEAPYQHNALTKLAGVSGHKKDLDWAMKNVPCQKACPAHTNIPEYLTAIYEERYEDAYMINLRDNVFPSVLGRVCARPCEEKCRHGWEGLGKPVAICFSKRAAADNKVDTELVILDKIYPDSGKTVAIIGAGPAGLACARNLALLGHTVQVYEQFERPGGMMVQGIPAFRLPREYVEKEIAQIEALGVKINCNVKIGDEVKVTGLVEKNDAVVLAAGTLDPNLLDLPGSELAGVRHGLDYLLEVNKTGKADPAKNVVVIGGGFTAMDCARTALRLGVQFNDENWNDIPVTESQANVRVIYRRSVDEMLVTPGELEELEHENIGLDVLASPVAYIGDGNGYVKAVKFIKNKLGKPDASGRRRPVPVEGSEFEVEADLVLLATGQFPDSSWVEKELKSAIGENNGWLTSDKNGVTGLKNVFLAGDFATGARSLINAIGHAKKAARAVDEFLMQERRILKVVTIEDDTATGRIREMDFVDLMDMPVAPLEKRSIDEEVEKGYNREIAVDEAQRCYRCHYKFEIDTDKCIYCDWCVKAKPRPECIVKIAHLEYDEDGKIMGFKKAQSSEDTRQIYINQEDCIRCGACVDACPVDAISVQKVSRIYQTCDGRCGII